MPSLPITRPVARDSECPSKPLICKLLLQEQRCQTHSYTMHYVAVDVANIES